MKKFIFLNILFIPLLSFANVGEIIFLKGNAYKQIGGGVTFIKNGDPLNKGDIVKTSDNSVAILSFKDGSKVKLGSLSSFQIHEVGKTSSASLLEGSAFINVLKSKLNTPRELKFKLNANKVAMGVRGTVFFASFGKQDDVWMCVREGSVEVKGQKDKNPKLVQEGQGVVIKKGIKSSTPKPLAWTEKLNWKFDPSQGSLENKVSIEEAYSDILDIDYD